MDIPLAKERLDKIEANARLVMKTAAEDLRVDVRCDRDGVVWLDGFLQRQHAQQLEAQHQGQPTEDFDGLVNVLGSFLGECMVNAHGGMWRETENGLGVAFPPKDVVAYPFAKVRKHLLEGAGDSVLSMFDVIPVLLEQAGDSDGASGPYASAQDERGGTLTASRTAAVNAVVDKESALGGTRGEIAQRGSKRSWLARLFRGGKED